MVKFVEKNSILKKINELSRREEYHGFFLSHGFEFLEVTNLTNLANGYPNGDGMEQIKIGLRQKNYRRENGSSSFDSLNSWLIILKIREQKKILDITIGDCLTN